MATQLPPAHLTRRRTTPAQLPGPKDAYNQCWKGLGRFLAVPPAFCTPKILTQIETYQPLKKKKRKKKQTEGNLEHLPKAQISPAWQCWPRSSWNKPHHQKSSFVSSPAIPQHGMQGRNEPSKGHPKHQLDLQHPAHLRPFIGENTNIPPNLNHSLSKTQVFTVTKQTPVQLQDSAVPHAVRKVSGCRSECIIGLIYSYQHGTWFESSITVTSHSGVCMLQRVSKLERNLPPAAEHYITINRKQAESSRRSPSLACTVMLMEMYTHSSICTYYGACQTVGLHGKKD